MRHLKWLWWAMIVAMFVVNIRFLLKEPKSYFVSETTLFTEGIKPTPFFDLQYINTQVLQHGLRFKKTPVGGLSALTYYPKENIFFSLSDDKGKKGFPRFYKFKWQKKENKIEYKFTLEDQVFLLNERGGRLTSIDPEGIAFLKPDKLFISSEGVQLPILTAPPAVFSFNLEGQKLSSLPVPNMYWDAERIGKWGVQENKGFESLSIDPKGKELWFATEAVLHQDTKPLETEALRTQYLRFSRFHIKKQKMIGQFVYPMDLSMVKGELKGKNGLTDFLVLGKKKLITVERAYLKKDLPSLKKSDAVIVRLFLTDCSQADDVSAYPQFKGEHFVTCGKTLLRNLSNLPLETRNRVDMETRNRVDNIEGIALGPEVSKGTYLLVLVSDDNFRKAQKTQFLFFHYKKH